jgi:hypothetical protein
VTDLPARSETLDHGTAVWLVEVGHRHVDELLAGDRDGAAASSPRRGRPVDPRALELQQVQRLRSIGLTPPQSSAVIAAVSARRKLAPLLRQADWPPELALLLTASAAEQASHPLVAAHRAQRFGSFDRVVDLCCGAGLDTISLAMAGPEIEAVDLDPARVVLCEHNTASLSVTSRVGDALEQTPRSGNPAIPWHADPGRRVAGRRARTLAQTQPPSGDLLQAMAFRPGGGLVLSPGVAMDDVDLVDGQMEFVQVGNTLVEAVLWTGDLAEPDVQTTATRLDISDAEVRTSQLHRRGPAPAVPVGELDAWLLEPAPAAARGRLHHQLALEIGARRIATNRALCTAAHRPDTTWWTAWEVEADLPGRPKTVAQWLKTAPELPLSISLHGVNKATQGNAGGAKSRSAQPIDAWLHALRGHPRGPVGRRIHVVAHPSGLRAVITRSSPDTSTDPR